MTMPTYSLFDLNEHVRRVIALNFSEPVWIIAEVAESNLSNGHLYLSLIQKTEPNTEAAERGILAQAQAAVWQRELRKIRLEHGPIAESVLQMGSLVRLLVKVSFHERYGLKLHVLDIDPTYTLGAAALQRRQTIEWLQKEGLLHRNAQLPLPLVLQRVAVITSQEAAGFHDFKAHLQENSYGYHFQLTFFFTSVQGKNAEKEIVEALNEITHRHNQFDVAVIVRGGGAKLDLLTFDDRNICSTVGKMPIPVFSGIGHEIDEAVLDLTAHTSFKTPTAVAQFLIERSAQFETTINKFITQVGKDAYFQVQTAHSILNSKQLALQFSAQNIIVSAGQYIGQLQEKIGLSIQHQLVKEKQLLVHSENIVTALSPATILQRGYSLTLVNGQIIRNQTEVQKGDQLETRLASGLLLSRVE